MVHCNVKVLTSRALEAAKLEGKQARAAAAPATCFCSWGARTSSRQGLRQRKQARAVAAPATCFCSRGARASSRQGLRQRKQARPAAAQAAGNAGNSEWDANGSSVLSSDMWIRSRRAFWSYTAQIQVQEVLKVGIVSK
jgi:hypothetical protein